MNWWRRLAQNRLLDVGVMTTAATTASPNKPATRPAAAKMISLSHSFETIGWPDRVCENTSVRMICRCWSIHSPTLQCI